MAAVIPNVNDLGQPQYSGQAQVYNAPAVRPAQGQNTAGVVGEFVEEEYKKKQLEEVANAKLALQLGRIEQDNAYNNDNDVDTIEERWDGKMIEHLGNAAMNISEGELREGFVQDAQATMMDGRMKIKQFAFTKKADQQMAGLTTASDIIMKAAVLPGGDVVAGMEAIELKWSSAAAQGYTSFENAAAQIRGAKYAIAEGKIKGLPPRQQLEALDEKWAMELPNNILVALRLEAEELLLLGDAQSAAAHGAGQNWNEHQFDMYLYNTPAFRSDPKLLIAAQKEFARLRTNKLSAKVQTSTELYSKYDEMLRDGALNGSFTIDTFKAQFRDDWKAISPAMRNNLEALEKEAINPTPLKYSNMDVYEELMSKWDKGPDHRDAAKQYYFENSARLNATDRKIWLKLVYGGASESLFNWQQLMEDEMVGMSTSQKANAYSGVNRWYLSYQETHDGAEPDDALINEQIHKAAIKYATGIVGSASIHSMDLPDRISAYDRLANEAEREEFLSQVSSPEKLEVQLGWLKGKDAEIYNSVMSSYVTIGADPRTISFKEFETLFAELMGRRAAARLREKEDRLNREQYETQNEAELIRELQQPMNEQ